MIKLPVISAENDLFIFLLHTIHERFRDNAVLKGGMVLRLLGSKRRTLDLDYTFIPFTSKGEILDLVEALFKEINGLTYKITANSKAIRISIEVGKWRSQVEINVAPNLKTDVMSTAHMKDTSNAVSPRIIKIISLDVALAHKLAAWNERRLMRDLYDVYYFLGVQNISPDLEILKIRLGDIQSRIPGLKKIKSMDLSTFFANLKMTIDQITQGDIVKQLDGLLEEDEMVGLSYKMKDTIGAFISRTVSHL